MNLRPAQPLATANARAASAQAATAAEAEALSPTPSARIAADGTPRFPAELAGAIDRCWSKAGAPADWGLTRQEFGAALERSAAKRFAAGAASAPSSSAFRDPKKIEAYLDTLHARDLALALACANGNATAWDFFVAEYRPELYRAARAIVGQGSGGDAAARELADSLYADLYGLRESAAGRRKSLFEYFHGRSKLSTWLHAVLSQRHVDEIRRTRASEPLENEAGEVIAEAEAPAAAANAARASSSVTSPETDPERANYLAALQAALAAALGALEPRDRLRLACYYADDRTLAEIGRLLGEHEATVSRKLERTRRDVRSRVENWLRDAKKWSDAQVRACLECARGEWPFDLTAHLQPGGATDAGRDASAIGSGVGGRKI
jgi:RNA polymerase sigma factor (sigma-70 family)